MLVKPRGRGRRSAEATALVTEPDPMHSKSFVAALLASVLALPRAGAAQSLHFDKFRLARLDTMLDQAVQRRELAGVVVLVMQRGRPVYERAVGWADRDAKRPMHTDAIFRIASQTKAITSVALM